ncbi:ribosomal protein L1 [Mycobacterium sp. URHB0021]
MSKTSKAYREAAEKIDKERLYTPLEAAKLAKETSSKKQDATVEVAIRLGVDPRKADQMVRGTVNLPHGTTVRPPAWRCSPSATRPSRPRPPAQTSSAATI